MFDAYHKWLGIPKDQRPPTHYQLLGVSPGEQDKEVIEEAAIRQTTHVRAFQIGQHAEDCTRILKEIAKARLTLLNSAKRKEYDAQLAPTSTAVAPSAAPAPGAPAVAPPLPAEVLDAAITTPSRIGGAGAGKPADVPDDAREVVQTPSVQLKKDKKPLAMVGMLVGVAVVGVILVVGALAVGGALLYFSGGDGPKKDGSPVVAIKDKEGKKPPRDAIDVKKDNDKIGLPKDDRDHGQKDVVNKDDVKKDDGLKDDVKKDNAIKKPPDVGPKGDVIQLALKGKVAPELLLELPKNLPYPYLTSDGLRLVYAKPQKGTLCFREAPAFDKEMQGTIDNVNGLLQAVASSVDGTKLVLLVAENMTGKVVIWDWQKLAVEVALPTKFQPVQAVLAPDARHLAIQCVQFDPVAKRATMWLYLHRLAPQPGEVKEWSFDTNLQFFGFTPDSGTLFYASAKDQVAQAYAIKTNQLADLPLPQLRFHHTFAPDFARYAIKDSGIQLQIRSFDPQAALKTVQCTATNSLLDGLSFSPDSRYVLVGTHLRPPQPQLKPEEAECRAALLDLRDGSLVSVTEMFQGMPHKVQLGANGVAFVHRANLTAHLYRFPVGPGDTFVRNGPGVGAKPEVPLSSTAFTNRNSGKLIGVFGKLKTDGAPVVQWDEEKNEPNMQWQIVPVEDGWCLIVNVNSGTCLCVDKEPAVEGSRLTIRTKRDNDRSQHWKLVSAGKGDAPWLKIVHRSSGKIAAVADASMQNGTRIVLAEDAAAPSNLWKVDRPELVAKDDPSKVKDPPPTKVVRVAVPDADKLMEAEKAIREQFKKDYAKKAPADALALAEKLHKLAGESADDLAASYVLLREARDLYVKGGRAESAMKAVTDLAERFEFDEPGMRVETLAAFAKVTLGADSAKQCVEVALAQAGAAMLDDHFDAALKLTAAAHAIAVKASNTALKDLVAKQDKHVKEVAKEHGDMKQAEEKLAANAKDSVASLTVGLYLSFRKGHWDKGLALLAQSSDAELMELAKKDLTVADDDKARVELGDSWWNASEKKPAYQKSAMQWRAAHWYRQAMPSLKGLAEAKVADRIKVVDARPAPFRAAAGSGEVDRFKGHKGAVTWLSLSADGKRVFSTSEDGMLRVWNLSDGKSRILVGPQISKGPIASAALSPDERSAGIVLQGGKLIAVDLNTLKTYNAFTMYSESMPGLFWSSNTVLSYPFKTSWTDWTVGSGAGHGGILFPGPMKNNGRALVTSPNRDFGAVLCSEETLTYRVQNNTLRSQYSTISFDATAGAFPKEPSFIVLGGKEGNLRAYDLKTKANDAKEIAVFKGHAGTIRAVACTPDGKLMISGGDDKTVRVWDVASGKQLQRFPHPGGVTSLATTPDGRYALSACADGIIRVWSLAQ